jgi:hypothetical protein
MGGSPGSTALGVSTNVGIVDTIIETAKEYWYVPVIVGVGYYFYKKRGI